MKKLIVVLALMFVISGCYSIDIDSSSKIDVDTCEWTTYAHWYVWERSWYDPVGDIIGSNDGLIITAGKDKEAGETKARAQAEAWLEKYKECIKKEK